MMGAMAASLVSADPATLARFFRVLGDPTRVRLIQALEGGERSVSELVAEVGQRQPRVSAHLACLRHCGFVEYRRQGREVLYRLSLGNLRALIDGAADIMEPLAERLATCTRIGPDWT
jgi:DNA-binding transcriptional ArsR family regulator